MVAIYAAGLIGFVLGTLVGLTKGREFAEPVKSKANLKVVDNE